MLSLGPEAVTVEPDRRGAPNASLHGRKWPCRAGVNGGRGRFRQETNLLMLFRDGPQSYPSLEGPLARLRSGECRFNRSGTGKATTQTPTGPSKMRDIQAASQPWRVRQIRSAVAGVDWLGRLPPARQLIALARTLPVSRSLYNWVLGYQRPKPPLQSTVSKGTRTLRTPIFTSASTRQRGQVTMRPCSTSAVFYQISRECLTWVVM
jgi:hypothetical protein